MSARINTTEASDSSVGKSFEVMGSALTIAAGLSFFAVCMLLPLVGKAGVQTVHAAKNYYAFLVALLVSLGFSVGASIAKLMRRNLDQSPFPYLSLLLTALNALLLISLFAGLLKI